MMPWLSSPFRIAFCSCLTVSTTNPNNDLSVLILKSCAFHPNALVLRRREAASKDAPVRVGPGAAFWSILRDARLRLAPQDEVVGSPRQSTFTDNRTNFESGTLAACRQDRKSYCRSSARDRKRIG